MKITIDKLIELIVKEVITQLYRQGVEIKFDSKENYVVNTQTKNNSKKWIDLSQYRTPVLTENHLLNLEPEITEIEIPVGTVLTPGAKEIIKKRKLTTKQTEVKCRG